MNGFRSGLEDVDEADLEAELDGLGFDDELDIGLGGAEPAIPSYLQTGDTALAFSVSLLLRSLISPVFVHQRHRRNLLPKNQPLYLQLVWTNMDCQQHQVGESP